MTTDAVAVPASFVRAFARSLLILVSLVFGWFATMAVVMLVAEVAPAALAIAPDARLLGRIDHDTRLLKGSRNVFVLTSDRQGYVRRLYGAGAWLVLPALRNGCLDLRKGPAAAGNRDRGPDASLVRWKGADTRYGFGVRRGQSFFENSPESSRNHRTRL